MNPQFGFSIGSTVCPGLSKLIEECGEVLQVAGKLIATGGTNEHWDGSHLHRRMHDELADLIAAITFYAMNNGVNQKSLTQRAENKIEQFREWHAKQLATVAAPGNPK